MTRFLSASLQATEPAFRQGITRLEAANGRPSADIRLSTEVQQATKRKIQTLGLDPYDTTPQELYQALLSRVAEDDRRLTRVLQTLAATHVSAEADVVAGMAHALRELPDAKRCFALKSSSFKALIKKQPPKKAMKQLGYRSLESFLKHESPALIMAAAWLSEDRRWQKKLIEQYKRLSPSDFESRTISIVQLSTTRYKELVEAVVHTQKRNLLSFRELGVVVLLPLTAEAPAGSVTASLSLALHELNEIRASSTFLKLSQVRADFGESVQTIATQEATLNASALDQPVPWNIVQRYYAQLTHQFSEALFEPHIEREDMVWHPIESTLARLEPRFAFWEQGAHLGVLHDQQVVSCNVLDMALNYCNNVPFEQRIATYFKRSLWHELLLRYLQPASLEQTILSKIQPQLAQELAVA